MTSLSVVIPVYNAEKTIAPLCAELISTLAGDFRLEIVLVNDCSRDGTDRVCKEIQAEYPEIVLYARLSRNFGEHNAVMAGLNQARGEYVVIMDDDFQNPPEEVPKLVAELDKGYDVVYCQYPTKNDGFLRNLMSYLNGTMARVVLDKPANLYLSSFKGMNRFLVDRLIGNQTPRPYLDAIILRLTRNIGTVEVRHDQRLHGSSGYTLSKLTALWGDMLVSYSLIPLRFLTALGLILTVMGVASVGKTVVYDLSPLLTDPTELEKLTSVSQFFRGFELLAIGILGEYVGRIYLRLHQEPQFIIRELHATRTAPHQMEYRHES